MKSEYTIDPKGSDFAIQEHFNGFEIVHKATGKTHWMGDGVDMFFTQAGKAISPGTKAWERAAKDMLLHDQGGIYEAYFPEMTEEDYRGGRKKRTLWRIVSSAGVDLGVYPGATEEDALDAMARDAGYSSARAAEATGIEPFEGTVTPE